MSGVKKIKPSWTLETGGGTALELALNPKRPLLALASADGPIVIVDIEGKNYTLLSGHQLGCSSLAWSPEGETLVSIGQDGYLRWWDAATFKQKMENQSGASWGVKVAFSPDGKYLASAAGKKLVIWDSLGSKVCEYPDHTSTIAGVGWRPVLAQIVSCCYGAIKFWEIGATSPKRTFPWKGSMLTMAISPDGKYIATGDQDASVHFWNIKSGKDLMMSGYPTKVPVLSWSYDSRYLATAGAQTAIVWDCSGKGPAGTKPLMLGGPKELVSALAFAPEKNIVAYGSKDGLVFIWDLKDPDRPMAATALKNEVVGLLWQETHLIVVTSSGGVFAFESQDIG